MDHQEIEARLSDYRDGELTPAESEILVSHLSQCESCRAALALDAGVSRLLFRAVPPTPLETETLAAALLLRIEPGPPVSYLSRLPVARWAGPALAFAAAMAAVFASPLTASSDPLDALSAGYSWVSGSPLSSAAELIGLEAP